MTGPTDSNPSSRLDEANNAIRELGRIVFALIDCLDEHHPNNSTLGCEICERYRPFVWGAGEQLGAALRNKGLSCRP